MIEMFRSLFLKRKKSGFALLIVTISTGILISVLGLSLVQIHNSSMNVLRKNNKIYQAQLYALDEANLIRVMDYDTILNVPLNEVRDSGLFRKVEVNNSISPDNKFNIKTAIISVYDKDTSSLPLATYTIDIYKRI